MVTFVVPPGLNPTPHPTPETRVASRVCIIQYNASQYLTRVDRSARALAGAGFEVVLVAIHDAATSSIEQRDGYTVKRFDLWSRRLPRRFGLKFLRFGEAIWKSFLWAWREDADIYNPRDAEPLLSAYLAARLRGARIVYDSDELCLDRNNPLARRTWWRTAMKAYEGFFVRRADAVITSDLGRAEVIAERYNIPVPAVVRNVPDLAEAPAPDVDFRATALGASRYLLIYQGILAANRGLPELITALHSLPECSLALVGYGRLEEALRAQIVDQDLSDRVRVFDPVPFERLMSYTAAADIGMIPLVGSCLSYVLAAPNKLFEYMLAGIPVAATDLPEMRRVIDAEEVGVLIDDPTDPASIAGAVSGLLALGQDGLAAMGARAREAALARHTWEVERPTLLATYESIARGRR